MYSDAPAHFFISVKKGHTTQTIMLLRIFLITLLLLSTVGTAQNSPHDKGAPDTSIYIIKTVKSDDENNNDENEKTPWAQRNHLLFQFSWLGATLPGMGFSTGVGLCREQIGIHIDTDYYDEWTWSVFPAESHLFMTLLGGPAFRLKWFRIHVLTGISLLAYTARGNLDSTVYIPCENYSGCFTPSTKYYHEEIEGETLSWPVALKWYFARRTFGIGMKLQTNINTVHSFFSAGLSAYFLVPR